ncbi:uncharacterized protein A4U43_C07F5170 [Asparagus officinalis]|uniref:Uncharacterized protein n=1 Tax=Asparagus officinalis TaxID=4686 RepID=A0A5P1E9W7_ASPOF|nr:cell number regulator 8 [Asparagus officinalis]ONK62543.1 uncharacterized protein A4U43_C07F5170 [Asparagus officinalis]
MANPEESSPLLSNPRRPGQDADPRHQAARRRRRPRSRIRRKRREWTARGFAFSTAASSASVVGAARAVDSSLFACLGRNDEFCSSDLEVCLLGGFAPCVLYGSNAERLGSGPGSFANSCLPYAGLYMLGNTVVGGNCIAPWFSYPSRTAIRHKFNLEGTCEALARSCGLCSSIIQDEAKLEQMESACDFATHFFCHPCSLCQEGRELRRRMPHPGFNARSLMVMVPPTEQRMGRGGM